MNEPKGGKERVMRGLGRRPGLIVVICVHDEVQLSTNASILADLIDREELAVEQSETPIKRQATQHDLPSWMGDGDK